MGLSASAGGPTLYLGRHMKTSQKGMGIDRDDYAAFKNIRRSRWESLMRLSANALT
jgi:hypothetical protein